MKNSSNTPQNSSHREPKRPNRKPPLPSYKRSPFSWLIVAIIIFTAMMMLQQGLVTKTLTWDQFIYRLDQGGQIESLSIGETEITGKFRQGSEAEKENDSPAFKVNYRPDAGAKELLNQKLQSLEQKAQDDPKYALKYEYTRQQLWMLWLLNWLLPVLLLVGFFYFFFARNLRGGAGGMLMSFGRSRHRVQGKDRVKRTAHLVV